MAIRTCMAAVLIGIVSLPLQTGCARNRDSSSMAGDGGIRSGFSVSAPPGPAAPAALAPQGAVEHNVRVNQDENGANQNETTIAVNPADPANLVAGAKHTLTNPGTVAFYSSADGGLSWTAGLMEETQNDFQTDPVATFCRDGSAIFALLSINPGQAIFAYRSTDGGLTWPQKSAVREFPDDASKVDKPWLACDTSTSPWSDRVYVEYLEFEEIGFQRIMLAWSDDLGQTWSDPVEVSDTEAAQNQGVVAVGPEGEVYLVWVTQTPGGGLTHLFDRSLDGGMTWGTDSPVVVVDPIPRDPNFLRGSYPSMDVDRTGAHAGNLYVVWSDQRHGDPDILLTRSTNGGLSWSAPVRVNDDPLDNGADQFHPWVAVDPLGRVVVAFWDRRRFAGKPEYEIWGAVSRDGGLSFDTNFIISDVPSDSRKNTFLGDYSALAVSREAIHPFWTDLRSGAVNDSDVYSDRYPNLFTYDEVDRVRWSTKSQMAFEPQDERFGVALGYDVLTGLLGDLRIDGGYDHTVCGAAEWPDPPYVDGRTPPAGDGYYYLVRTHGRRGVGSYGDGSPAMRLNVRDPLDETLEICPSP